MMHYDSLFAMSGPHPHEIPLKNEPSLCSTLGALEGRFTLQQRLRGRALTRVLRVGGSICFIVIGD